MKGLIVLLLILCSASAEWLNDFDEAKEIARNRNQYILLNFSGSDWCASCINMKREVFSSQSFIDYAKENLVLVRADFPRLKKNRLDATQVKHNELLAEKYNQHGKFPYTLLLNYEGKVIGVWDGYSSMTPGSFIEQIQKYKAL
jgi:thioredoxin-related protein